MFLNFNTKKIITHKKLYFINKNSQIILLNKLNIFLYKKNYIVSFLRNKILFKYVSITIKKLYKNLLFSYCNFVYAKIFLMVGLGFKKKYYDMFSFYCMDVGRRKWVIFKLESSNFFFNLFRKNICILTHSKKSLHKTILRLKCLRKETVFKVKGIMTSNRIIFSKKISRSVLFARRVKFRKLKLKPTKKQKLKK